MTEGMNVSAWRPLLRGEALERARAVVEELAVAVSSPAPLCVNKDWSPSFIRVRGASLGSGLAGQALFCGYLHQWDKEERSAALGVELLDRAIEVVCGERMAPTLYGGFPGIAWAGSHLAGRLYEAGEEDAYEETDEVLREYVRQRRWPFHYDLISGLVGIGVYGLERLPRASARRCLEAVVERLEEVAERGAAGITWSTPPELLIEERRQQHPQGLHDLGMAHGISGVVSLLAWLWSAQVSRERVGPLLEGAVTWLLSQTLPAGSASRYPNWRGAGQEAGPSRLAWCYGDPGVAASLLRAAGALDRADWRREGMATALGAARRPLAASGVKDACLCHGSAGLAHIFNRLYQATGEQELGAAAQFWYEQLLAARAPGEDHGGYRFERVDLPASAYARGAEAVSHVQDSSFLSGTAGVGLVLLAATTAVEPAWDRVLLTNIPAGACL